MDKIIGLINVKKGKEIGEYSKLTVEGRSNEEIVGELREISLWDDRRRGKNE